MRVAPKETRITLECVRLVKVKYKLYIITSASKRFILELWKTKVSAVNQQNVNVILSFLRQILQNV